MVSELNPMVVAKRLGRENWYPPTPMGPAGFVFDHKHEHMRFIITDGPVTWPGTEYRHASVSRPGEMPSYEDMVLLHYAAWGTEGWAYQAFAPQGDHINIHEYALHLWGMPDGSPMLPNFGVNGTI